MQKPHINCRYVVALVGYLMATVGVYLGTICPKFNTLHLLFHISITGKSRMLFTVVFWDMMKCSLVDGYHCFKVTYASTIT
jgi:uncharacterized membrane protein